MGGAAVLGTLDALGIFVEGAALKNMLADGYLALPVGAPPEAVLVGGGPPL